MTIRTVFVRIARPDQLDKNSPIGQIAILALDKEYNKVYTITNQGDKQMTIGRHTTTKSPQSPTFSKEWSGVSYAPHSNHNCPDCGERLHKESDSLYCPRCDNFKGIK